MSIKSVFPGCFDYPTQLIVHRMYKLLTFGLCVRLYITHPNFESNLVLFMRAFNVFTSAECQFPRKLISKPVENHSIHSILEFMVIPEVRLQIQI